MNLSGLKNKFGSDTNLYKNNSLPSHLCFFALIIVLLVSHSNQGLDPIFIQIGVFTLLLISVWITYLFFVGGKRRRTYIGLLNNAYITAMLFSVFLMNPTFDYILVNVGIFLVLIMCFILYTVPD